MSRRSSDFGPKDLTVAEIVVLQRANTPGGVHGYGLAELFSQDEAKNGTIYRRLGGLARRGYLSAEIETEDTADSHTGRARKLYHTTDEGNNVVVQALALLGISPNATDESSPYTIGEPVDALPEPH